jgi:hypothetical protein
MKFRKEKLEPQLTKVNRLVFEPKRIEDLMETEEPTKVFPSMLKPPFEDELINLPANERPDPTRRKSRIDTELPQCKKLITEALDDILDAPLTLNEDPIANASVIDIRPPALSNPANDTDDPNRQNCRTEKDDPKTVESKIDIIFPNLADCLNDRLDPK